MIRSKILLFDNWAAIYLSDVKYDEDKYQYTGHVVNGNYHMTYDTDRKVVACDDGSLYKEVELLWIGDAGPGDYNEAITDAKQRLADGEPANYNLTQIIGKDDLERPIPY